MGVGEMSEMIFWLVTMSDIRILYAFLTSNINRLRCNKKI